MIKFLSLPLLLVLAVGCGETTPEPTYPQQQAQAPEPTPGPDLPLSMDLPDGTTCTRPSKQTTHWSCDNGFECDIRSEDDIDCKEHLTPEQEEYRRLEQYLIQRGSR